MSWSLEKIKENSFYGIYSPARHAGITAFEQIHKARRAAELSRTGIKILVRDGVFYLFPDGHKMPIASTIDLKVDTIAAWLAALYMIRRERGA